LWAPSLRELVADTPEVLILDTAVEELDFSTLEARYQPVGAPGYPPQVLFKVLVFGYAQGMYASRQLARACRKDDDFRFLAHGLTPDFRTLCRFRHMFLEQLKQLFRETVRLCREAGLVELGHVAIDGTKMRANRSRKALALLLQSLQEAEQAEADLVRQEEAAFMKLADGGVRPAYNAQAAVDGAHGVIVAEAVTCQAEDKGQLAPMVAQVKANCEAAAEKVTADGGYYSEQGIAAVEQESELYVRPPTLGGGRLTWVEEEQAFRCPRGHLLKACKQRHGRMVYRTSRCGGCPQAAKCGIKGRNKEVHVPLPDTPLGKVGARMLTAAGQALYRQRQMVVEPVFGVFKHGWRFRRFHLRGRHGAAAEWSLLCTAHNLMKYVRWQQSQATA